MNKEKKDLLKKIQNTYCRLRASKIEGVGIFAIRDIPKGINPFYGVRKEKWIKFNKSEIENLDESILEMVNSFFVVNKDGSVYMSDCGLHGMNVSYFLNHSKKPNVTTNKNGENFITLRKIKKGEELSVSYSIYAHNEKYKI
ncbi:MAG: SET domain-containing protein [Candidatus Staskawiczbacteria bacterium]|jgi:SET domain-containing protein